ncbi:carbohydrate sulfotransferase 6 isoform X2 [Hippocampus zosterae]|uniref:carbohydrate sulfotransferase 6 isoform X2 n=1 Tax=Hippocampus zosterae TaxID=109293 RepID=UPI00223CD467|nr:carbohydrate sulfotransferase 6 isoform X2 [Hippocampus zosterae]
MTGSSKCFLSASYSLESVHSVWDGRPCSPTIHGHEVTVTRTITIWANLRPWLTGEIHRLLRARNMAFRAGDVVGLRTARANLSQDTTLGTRQYSRRIADHFNDSRDTRNLGWGIQTITKYSPQTCDSSISLLNSLNDFFARFEVDNNTPAQKTPPPSGDQVLTLFSGEAFPQRHKCTESSRS